MSKNANGSEAFGALLRSHRAVAGFTQEELARRAGLSARAIANWERGRTQPYRRSVALLADALALSGEHRQLFVQLAHADRAAHRASAAHQAEEELQDEQRRRPGAPRQLPMAPRQFVGRTAELDLLSSWLSEPDSVGAATIAAISGAAGTGKTALALHWAHLVAPRFRHGQLFVNLQGFAPEGRPLAPHAALNSFLGALGVAASQIPADTEGRIGLYRSHLARNQMLIVLDNAFDETQVRPLLPAAPGCLVIATSRSELASLAAVEGARLLVLDILSDVDARDLLATRLGTKRAAADSEAVNELASLCAGLPVALSIVAARADMRPQVKLADLAAELRAPSDRLGGLDVGDVTSNIRAVFSSSYRRLSMAAAHMFRLIGLHPGSEITIAAAASLSGLTAAESRTVLAELIRVHMVTESPPHRFSLHELLRAYAVELSRALPDDVQHEAVHRLLDHYLDTAISACRMLDQIDVPFGAVRYVPGSMTEELKSSEEACAWFDAERLVLNAVIAQAADQRFDIHAWQLTHALRTFYIRGRHFEDLAAAQRISLAAACRIGDPVGQAASHRYLAVALESLNQQKEAETHLSLALQLYRSFGDELGAAGFRPSP